MMIGGLNNHILPVTIFLDLNSKLILIIKPELIPLALNIGIIGKIDASLFNFIHVVFLPDSLDYYFSHFHAF